MCRGLTHTGTNGVCSGSGPLRPLPLGLRRACVCVTLVHWCSVFSLTEGSLSLSRVLIFTGIRRTEGHVYESQMIFMLCHPLRPLSRRVCSSRQMFSVCCVCETVPSTIVPKQHVCGPRATAPPHTQTDKCFLFLGVCSMCTRSCTMMSGGRRGLFGREWRRAAAALLGASVFMSFSSLYTSI